MRAENDEAVGHLADTIARLGYTVNGPGAMADEAIGRIGEIRRLGAAGSLGEYGANSRSFAKVAQRSHSLMQKRSLITPDGSLDTQIQ